MHKRINQPESYLSFYFTKRELFEELKWIVATIAKNIIGLFFLIELSQFFFFFFLFSSGKKKKRKINWCKSSA